MNILGIETSCDETAAAVVRDGRTVLSNVVLSQIPWHRPYGGVVPEIASRRHVETLAEVTAEAVNRAGLRWSDLDAVAVTYGPGLAPALAVGVSFAKGLALSLHKPFVPVHHLEAHICSIGLETDDPPIMKEFPFMALVVSGGHTCLVRVEGVGRYVLVGTTLDDAAGEAFDKGANLLGLGYPGGPAIERAARDGRPDFVSFPRGRPPRGRRADLIPMDRSLCFSFSGVKTALLYYLMRHPISRERAEVPSLAASYQEAIVDTLVARCRTALKRGPPRLVVVGGVARNRRLRERLAALAREDDVSIRLAGPAYCADNAAMVAAAAGLGGGHRTPDPLSVDVDPNASLGAA